MTVVACIQGDLLGDVESVRSSQFIINKPLFKVPLTLPLLHDENVVRAVRHVQHILNRSSGNWEARIFPPAPRPHGFWPNLDVGQSKRSFFGYTLGVFYGTKFDGNNDCLPRRDPQIALPLVSNRVAYGSVVVSGICARPGRPSAREDPSDAQF